MKKITATKNKKCSSGQSIIEMVFSIGVVALVVTASVILIVNAIGLKNSSFLRKKAADVAQSVMEDLVDKSKNSDTFWNLTSTSGQTDSFSYSVSFTQVKSGNCNTGSVRANWDCVDAVVEVNWGNNQELKVIKFFQR